MRTTISISLTLVILSLFTIANAPAGTIYGPGGSSFTIDPYKISNGGNRGSSDDGGSYHGSENGSGGNINSQSQSGSNNVQNGALNVNYDYRMGPYVRIVHATVRDPRGLWEALLPLQPPPGARGAYGLIGDDNLLGQSPGFGLRQLGAIARQYVNFDSIYVVQPPGFSDIGVRSGVYTSAAALNDVTLGWVFFDLRPKFEADLRQLLKLTP